MSEAVPPVAKRIPHDVLFGAVPGEDRGVDPIDPPRVINDDLFWLRDDARKDPEVLQHLEAENAYTDAVLAGMDATSTAVLEELKARMVEDDDSVPYQSGKFNYFTRQAKGCAYTIHCRRPFDGGSDQVVLDENKVAEGLSFCNIESVTPSPSHELLAYAVDTVGSESYEIRILDLKTGAQVDSISDTASDVHWGKGDKDVYYVRRDDADRPFKVWCHTIGEPATSDILLIHERDERFWLYVERAPTGQFIFVKSASADTSEVSAIDLTSATSGLVAVVARRQEGVLYTVADRGDHFLVVANVGDAKNFSMFYARKGSSHPSAWKPVVGFEYDPNRFFDFWHGGSIHPIATFRDYVVVFGREEGMHAVWILNMPGESIEVVSVKKAVLPGSPPYVVDCGENKEYNASKIELLFSTLTFPQSTLHCQLPTGHCDIVKQKRVPNYDRSLYTSERIFITVRDGVTRVPVSMVYRTDAWKKPGPMLLHGYGAYGDCGGGSEPNFDAGRLPLLDRGVCFAIAHVRGGCELGRQWYEDGKYLCKKNSVTDFIDCAEHLKNTGLVAPDRLAISGRSAGGLLMGAALNMGNGLQLCRAVVTSVPFVDLMVTICDPSIPLTVTEWTEWGNCASPVRLRPSIPCSRLSPIHACNLGNPNSATYFEYMASYSPMENVKKVDYPAMLVTAGLHDPRVPYWEPAKWVSRLRQMRTNSDLPIVLKVDLNAGHFVENDRYKRIRSLALEHAFVLEAIRNPRRP